ncbi:MAG: hypothetical protein KDE27_09300 [Planctomycetes bacterium]|nr:hypothetical protein [Planctomycetota bacterium]
MAVGHVCDLRRRERARAAVPLDDDVPSGDPADDWQAAWRDEHLRWALARATARASDRDARAFRALLAGCDATAVAAELGLRRNHVYKIKSRLLAEVRRLLERVQSH